MKFTNNQCSGCLIHIFSLTGMKLSRHKADVIETHCYIVDIRELIVSRYVAKSITTDCRTFRPNRSLSTAYKTKRHCSVGQAIPDTMTNGVA